MLYGQVIARLLHFAAYRSARPHEWHAATEAAASAEDALEAMVRRCIERHAGRLEMYRLAVLAHTSAMGLLTMQPMVSNVDDPLCHDEQARVDALCRALRAAMRAS